MAPEVLEQSTGYDAAADVWSLGVILFVLLCCEYPFGFDGPAEQGGQPTQTCLRIANLAAHSGLLRFDIRLPVLTSSLPQLHRVLVRIREGVFKIPDQKAGELSQEVQHLIRGADC